jgi:hypothetical protein
MLQSKHLHPNIRILNSQIKTVNTCLPAPRGPAPADPTAPCVRAPISSSHPALPPPMSAPVVQALAPAPARETPSQPPPAAPLPQTTTKMSTRASQTCTSTRRHLLRQSTTNNPACPTPSSQVVPPHPLPDSSPHPHPPEAQEQQQPQQQQRETMASCTPIYLMRTSPMAPAHPPAAISRTLPLSASAA